MKKSFCRAGIAMGSNIEPRSVHMNLAADFLRGLCEDGAFRISRWYETAPVDCAPGTPSFLNAVAEIGTSLSPEELLAKLQACEISQGRPAGHEKNSPRTIDLDLLYSGDQICDSDHLTLPHPRTTSRAFVLKPLSEISPDFILPGQHQNIASLASRCDDSGLRLFSPQ
jgi:2-amino-4-hydroxy-6-hydroxymethyldihydropteridine diphosphokinase